MQHWLISSRPANTKNNWNDGAETRLGGDAANFITKHVATTVHVT